MLKIEKLKIYSPKVSIDQIEIGSSEVVKIEGASGSGKSSLMLALMGLKKFDCEIFSFEGRNVPHLNPEKDDMAFVSQYHISSDETLKEYIQTIFSFKKNKTKSYSPWILEELNKQDFLKRVVNTLSGGEKQLVALSILEALSPKLAFLDEIFSSMDPETEEKVWRVMEPWFKKRAVLYTAHHPVSLDKMKSKSIEL